MRVTVTTEELQAAAAALRADAATARARDRALAGAADAASAWSCGRALDAVHAFFDTLGWAAQGAREGLEDLAGRLSAAAGDYEAAERAVPRPR
ncbi:hypothetical protein GTQ99_11835 [Kineococcus sp. T13]|uniref:WXG100 family type VII secretion target n=1 Tax=Kineococcus vitellinus TaxID=2696565 RepID=UPI001411D102|nr:hypothetical protein [Kineococcus vitellinus]